MPEDPIPPVDPDRPYRYFFSYQTGLATGGIGYGHYCIALAHPIRGYHDLAWVIEAIRVNNPGNTNVVILGWQRFEDYE